MIVCTKACCPASIESAADQIGCGLRARGVSTSRRGHGFQLQLHRDEIA
jgi:hypothetical protein